MRLIGESNVIQRIFMTVLFCGQIMACAAVEPPVHKAKALAPEPERSSGQQTDAAPPEVTDEAVRPPAILTCRRGAWPAAIKDNEICEDSIWTCTAPDCRGGTVEVPYWLRGVNFWDVLCVHATGKKETVNFGDSLIETQDALSGDARWQVYYALRQPDPIPIGEKEYLWAVCGGGGNQLTMGTRVHVAPGLPRKTAIELATTVMDLESYEKDLQFFRGEYCGAGSATNKAMYLEKVVLMRKAIGESTERLRGALMMEHGALLQGSKRPQRAPKKPMNAPKSR